MRAKRLGGNGAENAFADRRRGKPLLSF